MFRRLYLRWVYRNQTRQALAESHLILLKSARRCAYDLQHAVDNIPPDSYYSRLFRARSQFWLEIFSPAGIKDYRLEMIETISRLERENEKLRALMRKHLLDPKTLDDQPF